MKAGGFVQSKYGELYYFEQKTRRLYDMKSDYWAAYLYSITGANPAGQDFAYLLADCKAEAMEAECQPVLKVAAWSDEEKVLQNQQIRWDSI